MINNRSSKSISKFLPVLALILVSVVVSGCSLLEQAEPTASAAGIDSLVTAAEGVTVEGRLVPENSVWLGFQVGGEVATVLVEEGQSVEAGDLLAVLGNPESIEASLKAAELELIVAQQALDTLQQTAELAAAQAHQALVQAQLAAIDAGQRLANLDTQAYQDDLDDAWTTVLDRKDDLEDAQETFDKYENLDEDNPTRRNAESDLEDAQKAYDDAVRQYDQLVYALEQARANAQLADDAVEQAEADYEDRRDGPDADDLALATARVEAAQAAVSAAQTALDQMTLSAPFGGVVTTVSVTQGETVTPGKLVIRLADFSQWYVETTDLDEIKVAKIDASQPVSLTVDALPDLALSGTVEQISQDFIEKSGDILYTVRIRLDDSDPDLRWGMTLSVTFEEK